MEILTDLRDFSGLCRLFPLPNVALFPHVILPLHIFEPRYRQMTRDALDGDRLVTIVQSRPLAPGRSCVEPMPIMDVACVGKIVHHDCLPDGRFNLLLLGCRRIRLDREVASGKLYRIAEGTVLEDAPTEDDEEPRRSDLIALFLAVLQMSHRLDPELSQLLHSGLSLGIVSDVIAHALDLPAELKQALLDESRVNHRVATLSTVLKELSDRVPASRPFPPPFSVN